MSVAIFKYRFILLSLIGLILFYSIVLPLKLAIAHYQAPYPQAILTLGGGPDREKFTAQFAQLVPNIPIWVSTGISNQQALQIFQTAGISEERIRLDRRAIDTVTNFTTLVKDLKKQDIQHIYLITSDFHMPRAVAIATIVLGSHGIAFTPIPIPSKNQPEPKLEILRDSGRSLFWLLTGRTGASLKKTRSNDFFSVKIL